MTQTNVLQEFDDLNFDGYPDTAQYPTSGYYMTTLGQESFSVDPWSFAQAMEGSPLYPNWDTTNLSPAAYDNNTIEEDIYSAFVQAKFDGEIGGMATQTVVGLRYEQTKVDGERPAERRGPLRLAVRQRLRSGLRHRADASQ